MEIEELTVHIPAWHCNFTWKKARRQNKAKNNQYFLFFNKHLTLHAISKSNHYYANKP
jgi:hypothetical protein